MRILLTNDDGIHAEGLMVLERIARTISDDVWVVAPETDQSGFAHSLSLSEPLRMRKVADKHYALRGTPTDCVIMGVRNIMPEPPDLVLSGVNSGSNIADDVTYSGTVAGAMEGTLIGIRSIALSQSYHFENDGRVVPWSTAETLAPDLLQKLTANLRLVLQQAQKQMLRCYQLLVSEFGLFLRINDRMLQLLGEPMPHRDFSFPNRRFRMLPVQANQLFA